MSRHLCVPGILVLILGLTTLTAAGAKSPRPLALDPSMKPSDYVLQRWGIDEGLPQVAVVAIEQTPDGYLWIATEVALARFDGVSFRVFDHLTTPGLDGQILTLEVRRDGALWMGTYDGVLRMKDGRIRKFTRDQGLPVNSVPAILERKDGSMWFATSQGIGVLRNGQFTRFSSAQGPATRLGPLAGRRRRQGPVGRDLAGPGPPAREPV